jgi:transposase-like protein
MSGRKGMLHYRMEIKEEAVRLVLEEHMTYAAVADKLNMRIKAWYGCIEQKMGIRINHKAVLRLTLAPARKCRCAQAGHSFPNQKAKNAQKTGRN